jgi:hypothetical protein
MDRPLQPNEQAGGSLTQPGLAFWLQWVAACGLFGVFAGAVTLLGGYFAICVSILSGLVLGFLQALTLRKYVGKQIAVLWLFSTGVGWLGATVLLFVGDGLAFALAMGGNDVDVDPIDPRGFVIIVAVLAGALFGLIQRLPAPQMHTAIWAIVNALTWGMGTFIGETTAFAVYPSSYPLSILFVPYHLLDVGIGAIAGMVVYGAISGFVVQWLLRAAARSARYGSA